MFEKFAEINPFIWIVLGVFLIAGSVATILIVQKRRENKSGLVSRKQISVQMLVHGALCIAIAFVLSYIRIYRFPQGGSITPGSMLPIMLFAYIYGVGPGAICSLGYGILQMIQDSYFVHPAQILMDYILAFGVLCITGLFANKKNMLPVGILVAGLCRFAFHLVSGMIFFAAYAAEAGLSPFVYSFGYNIGYVLPDMGICFVIALIPGVRNMMNRLRMQYRPVKA